MKRYRVLSFSSFRYSYIQSSSSLRYGTIDQLSDSHTLRIIETAGTKLSVSTKYEQSKHLEIYCNRKGGEKILKDRGEEKPWHMRYYHPFPVQSGHL